MADLPPELESAVRGQADARVAMDIQGYAKYLSPEAVDTLRASFPGIPPRVSGYEIASVTGGGSDYTVEVRYKVRDAGFVVRSRWRRNDGEWGVVHAERLWGEDEARPGLLSRLAAALVAPLMRRRR
jgi:hypothetical protein